MRPRLRAIATHVERARRDGRLARSLAAAAAMIALVACSACSAPGSEAALSLAHAAALSNSLTATSSAGDASSAQKARVDVTSKEARGDEPRGRCPRAMAEIDGKFCIDRYEASLVDVLPNGDERAHSPFGPVADLAHVRAVSAANVFPQGYISEVESARACRASGKRLCRVAEWSKACRGPAPRAYGYADRREPRRCNDSGKNPVISLYRTRRGRWNWSTMNQPDLNQQDSTLMRTGAEPGCTNGYGVYDMVGNLHEWVADPAGSFYGGYYQDVASAGHGEGCGYRTTAHEARYHDYSTGFRCCADVAGAPKSTAPPRVPRRSRKKR